MQVTDCGKTLHRIVCKFLRKCFTDFYGEAAEILAAVTGWAFTSIELRHTGERIRAVQPAADGALLLLTDSGKLLRVAR